MDDLDRLRNFGIIAHIDAGKTTLSERILFFTGKTHQLGEVHEGTATMDWMDQEQERGITITSASTQCHWNNFVLNLIDTPGHVDFTIEVERSLRVLDGAVVVLCSVGGVQPQTETVWRQSEKYQLPKICFINKLDRLGANFHQVCLDLEKKFQKKVFLLQEPIYENEEFVGIKDFFYEKNFYFKDQLGKEIHEESFDDPFYDKMLHIVLDFSDSLAEKYLKEEFIEKQEILKAFLKAFHENHFVLVCCGSALKNKGIQFFLDHLTTFLPSPKTAPAKKIYYFKNKKLDFSKAEEDLFITNKKDPFSAYAFKMMFDSFLGRMTYVRIYSGTIKTGEMVLNVFTGEKERVLKIVQMHANKREEINEAQAGDIVAFIGLKNTRTGETLCHVQHFCAFDLMQFPKPVMSLVIEPKSQKDEKELLTVLENLQTEDPSFIYEKNKETGQMIISGMGELHLEILTEKMKREYKIGINQGQPQVSYREGLKISLLEKKEEKFFTVFQKNFLVSYDLKIEKSEDNIIETEEEFLKQSFYSFCQGGIFTGYPLLGLKVQVKKFSTQEPLQEVEMKSIFDQILRTILLRDHLILLEPIMNVTIETPLESAGDILSDIAARQGRVLKIDVQQESNEVLHCEIALKKLFGFSTDLRSLSKGRASFSMQFLKYQSLTEEDFRKFLQEKGYII